MLTKKQERLAQRVIAALVLAERATGDDRAACLREAAEHASELRMTFPTSKDDERPDIRGRSYGYRTAMADVFAKAESSQGIRSAFRYHSNNVHKLRVGAEALREFGIDERTRSEQWNDRRAAEHAAAKVGKAQQLTGGPVRGRLRPLVQAQQQLATVDPAGFAELSTSDRQKARALAEAISAVASEALRVTK